MPIATASSRSTTVRSSSPRRHSTRDSACRSSRHSPAARRSSHPTAVRTWDVCATARVDRIAAISRHVERRVARYYRREATVIYPPVEGVYFEVELLAPPGEARRAEGAVRELCRVRARGRSDKRRRLGGLES